MSGILPTMAVVAVQPAGQGGRGLSSPQLMLSSLTPGQLLEGIVFGKDPQGALQLQTPIGIIMLRAAPEVARLLIQGDRVQLRMDNSGQQAAARLIGVNGTPVELLKPPTNQEKPIADPVTQQDTEAATPVTYSARGMLKSTVAVPAPISEQQATPTITTKATLIAATPQQQEALQKIAPQPMLQNTLMPNNKNEVATGTVFLLRFVAPSPLQQQPPQQMNIPLPQPPQPATTLQQQQMAPTNQLQQQFIPTVQTASPNIPQQAQAAIISQADQPAKTQPPQQQNISAPTENNSTAVKPLPFAADRSFNATTQPNTTTPNTQPQNAAIPQQNSASSQPVPGNNAAPQNIPTKQIHLPAGFVYAQIISPQQLTPATAPTQNIAVPAQQPAQTFNQASVQPLAQPAQQITTPAQMPVAMQTPNNSIPATAENPAPFTNQRNISNPTTPQITTTQTTTTTPATQQSATLVQTPFGTFQLAAPPPFQAPYGTTVAVQIQPFTAAHNIDGETPVIHSGAAWPALEETAEILQRAGALSSHYVQQRIAPHGPKMLAAAMFLLNALSSGNPRGWLGEKLLQNLEMHGRSKLAEKLQADFSQLQQLWQQADNDQWQATILPFIHDDRMEIAKLMVKNSPPANPNEGGSTRFLIEVELSHFGPLQLDGFYKYWIGQNGSRQNKRFDLHIRSHRRIEDEVTQEINRLFSQSLEFTGMTGQVGMQTVNPFPTMPPEESFNRTLQHIMYP